MLLAGTEDNTGGDAMVRPGPQRDHRGDRASLHHLRLEPRCYHVYPSQRVRRGSQVREVPTAGRRTRSSSRNKDDQQLIGCVCVYVQIRMCFSDRLPTKVRHVYTLRCI